MKLLFISSQHLLQAVIPLVIYVFAIYHLVFIFKFILGRNMYLPCFNLVQEDPGGENGTPSSALACEIPWTEPHGCEPLGRTEPGTTGVRNNSGLRDHFRAYRAWNILGTQDVCHKHWLNEWGLIIGTSRTWLGQGNPERTTVKCCWWTGVLSWSRKNSELKQRA